MASLNEHGIRLSSMSPSFLHSNSTSHTWPFSAVAELIDNASDPGVSAKQIWIDVVKEGDDLCLTFTDNGSGMTPNKLHKMLSFGFTEKGSGKASQQAIGVYGNGFKSGSMRLGRDALIFTKTGGCQSVGLLSQTYLENIKAQAVIVPIVPFNQRTKSLVVTEDSEASLAAILQHSVINSVEQIHQHFDSILSKKGTKILIWNLRRAKDGKSEIDFETDESDFRLPEIQMDQLKKDQRNGGSFRAEKNIPDMQYSLRAYLSILYLKPRTQVVLRGKKVQAKLVSKRLIHIEHDVYKPHFSKEKVKVTFGLDPKNKQHNGIMMYHKNRLIKAYEKVGWQLKTAAHMVGMGVVGVIECNFLKPAHNKQDFEYTKEYRLTLGAMGQKLNDYWKEKKAKERELCVADMDCTDEGPMWLQCEDCLKWRSVPWDHYKVTPESWNCSQNPNPRHKSCSSPEEAEDSEELLTPSYQKNHKKLEHHNSRKQNKALEVCEPKRRSSSEPVHPVAQSTFTVESTAKRRHAKKKTPENDETTTDHLPEHDREVDADAQKNDNAQTQQTAVVTQTREKDERDVSQWRADNETNVQGLKDGKSNTDMQTTEREKERADDLSRKSNSSFYYAIKKRHLLGKRHFDAEIQAQNSQMRTETNAFKTSSSDRDNASNRVENPDTVNQASSVHTWSHPLSSAQTMMVSQLSRVEGRQLSLDGGDGGAKVQRLAVLEKEVQKLQGHLDPGFRKTSRGTTTVTDSSGETPKQGLVSASTVSRDVGCQTDADQNSTSFTGMAQAAGPPGAVVLGQRVIFDPMELPGQNRLRKEKPDSQSKSRVSDSEAYEGSRSAQENLQDIRKNVVVLLTALLPHLDLTGISLETTDVDNILQQTIEINSLKL